MLEYFFFIEARGIHDGAFIFRQRNYFCPALAEEFGGMVSDITHALHDDGLAFYARFQFQLCHDLRHVAHFPDTKENTQPCRFPASSYSTLRNRLTRDTTQG